jgi:hypothetical protein
MVDFGIPLNNSYLWQFMILNSPREFVESAVCGGVAFDTE